MEDSPSLNVSIIRQFNRKEKLKKKQNAHNQLRVRRELLDEVNAPFTIFDVIIEKEYLGLPTILREEEMMQQTFNQFYHAAKNNKVDYCETRAQEKLNELRELSIHDSLVCPLSGGFDIQLGKKARDEEFSRKATYWVETTYSGAKEMLEMRNGLKDNNCNISSIAKFTRIFPSCINILSSPLCRKEIDDQFYLWSKKVKEIVNHKLSIVEQPIAESEPQVFDNSEMERIHSIFPDFGQIRGAQEHKQEIRMSGFLSEFLSMWSADEVIRGMLLTYIYLTGSIYVDETDSDYIINIELLDSIAFDCNPDDEGEVSIARKEFVRRGKEATRGKLENGQLSIISEMIFKWIIEIKKTQIYIQQKEDIDKQKVEQLFLQSFIDGIEQIEDLCDSLTGVYPFSNLMVCDVGSEICSITVAKDVLKNFFIAEVNKFKSTDSTIFSNDLRDFEEVTLLHQEMWVLSNLLIQSNIYKSQNAQDDFNKNEMEKLAENTDNDDFEQKEGVLEDLSVLDDSNSMMKNIIEHIFEEDVTEDDDQSKSLDKKVEDENETSKKIKLKEIENVKIIVDSTKSRIKRYSKIKTTPDYIPLFLVTSHFYRSVTDDILFRELNGELTAHEKLFKTFCLESKKTEIIFEIKQYFSLLVEIQKNTVEVDQIIDIRLSSDPRKSIPSNEFFLLIKARLPVIYSNIKFVKNSSIRKDPPSETEDPRINTLNWKELTTIDIHLTSEEFEEYVSGIADDFLNGKLSFELEKVVCEVLLDERFLEMIRFIDQSELAKKTIKLINGTLEDLEMQKTYLENFQEGQIITKCKDSFSIQGDPSLGLPKPIYFSERLDYSREKTHNSKESVKFYISMLEVMRDSAHQIICKSSASESSKLLRPKCIKILESMIKSGKNAKVEEKLKIKRVKDRYDLNKDVKTDWKRLRRLVPEFKNKGEKDMIISKEVWHKCFHFVENAYWKVQIGFVTWYALMVEGAPFEKKVIKLFEDIRLKDAYQRDVFIKIFGVLADHFKLFKDYDTEGIPWWVFSGSDCIFGYTSPISEERPEWQEDVLGKIIDWVRRRKAEMYASVPLEYDLELSMEHLLKEFKPAISQSFLANYEEDIYFLPDSSIRVDKEKNKELKERIRNARIARECSQFQYIEDDRSFTVISNFFDWSKKFLHFSVEGSAHGLNLMRNQNLMIDLDDDDAEEVKKEIPNVNFESIQKENSSIDSPRTLNITVPEPDILENAIFEDRIQTVEAKGEETKARSISKTVAFALGGKHLARLLYWVGGNHYRPESNIHLKVEQKKIRNVANSDLSSFVKQSYLYEWLHTSLHEQTKSKIFTLVHPRDKVLEVERLLKNYRSEKWSIPMDLKDFHEQFGKEHHQTLMRCLERRVSSIRDDSIREEMLYITRALKDELPRGNMFFFPTTSKGESYEKAYKKLSNEDKSLCFAQFKDRTSIKKRKVKVDGEFIEEEFEEKITNNCFRFEIQNGLISGWKLTSLMGSIYNCSTNYFCSFWHLRAFGIPPTNYIVQGDDTHFKCRFLSQALFHVGLVNAIGKVAHPDKQFFSTRMTEFLKKVYSQGEEKMFYSPSRIITSILFEKENRVSTANRKNSLKDLIDAWSLFFIRIPDESRLKYINSNNKRMFPQKSIWTKYMFYNQKGCGISEIDKVFSTPCNLNGALLGPLTKKELLCNLDVTFNEEAIGFTLKDKYIDVKMNDFALKEFHEYKPNHWTGVSSFVSGIIRRVGVQTGKAENSLRGPLQEGVFRAISESLNIYEEPKIKGSLDSFSISAFVPYFLRYIQTGNRFHKAFNFAKENMKLYLTKFENITIFGQLIVMNSTLSNTLESKLRNLGFDSFRVFQVLAPMKPKSKFTHKLYSQMNNYLTAKTMFKFALSNDLGVSVCRYIQHDEYMGMFSTIFNESLPLLFKDIFSIMEIMELLRKENFDVLTEEEGIAERNSLAQQYRAQERAIPKDYDKHIIDKQRIESEFIDFLRYVFEIYIFLNWRDVWKEMREFASAVIDERPFTFM